MQDQDSELEQLLLRYRPKGPTADLRGKVLANAIARAPSSPSPGTPGEGRGEGGGNDERETMNDEQNPVHRSAFIVHRSLAPHPNPLPWVQGRGDKRSEYQATGPEGETLPAHRITGRSDWLFRGTVAAMLLLALMLNGAAERMNATTAANIGIGPAVWTADAEAAARLVDGGPAGRQYIAICLMASTGRDAGAVTNRNFSGEFR